MMVTLPYPHLWPRNWRWIGDALIIQGTDQTSRVNRISDNAVERVDAQGPSWTFHFAPSGIDPYTFEYSVRFTDHFGRFNVEMVYRDASGFESEYDLHDQQSFLSSASGCSLLAGQITSPGDWAPNDPSRIRWIGASFFWGVQVVAQPW